MKRWLAPLAFALALAAAAPKLIPATAPRFSPPATETTASPKGTSFGASPAPTPVPASAFMAFSEHLLPNPAPSAHAPTLAELPDGRVAAAWFAGSREGARDVAILLASL